jgi:hypothetical protein
VYPQYRLWSSVLDKTAVNGSRSWHATSRKFPKTRKAWSGYKRGSCGWHKKIKGMPLWPVVRKSAGQPYDLGHYEKDFAKIHLAGRLAGLAKNF